MLTVPYEFYSGVYGGTLPESEFTRLLRDVVVDVDDYTDYALQRMEDDTADPILLTQYRSLCCHLVDNAQAFAKHNGAVVKSSSSGKVSESYLESSLPKSSGAVTLSLVEKYLGRWNLVCRWI